jgi:hypothetical protein
MGRAIFYCVQCSKRVSDADLETGKAYRIGERILCSDCTPEDAKRQSSRKVPAVNRPRNSGTSVAMKSVTAPLATPPSETPASDRRKRILFAGGGGAALLVLIVVLIFAFRRSPPPAPPQEPPPQESGAKPPDRPAGKAESPDAKEASAREDLDKARAFAKANPEDLAGQQREFTDLVWKWEGTEAARDAAKDAAAVKAAILKKVEVWAGEMEAQIKDLVAAKQYIAAEKKIQELKAAHDLAEWKLAAEKRASEMFVLGKRQAEEERAANPGEKPNPGSEAKKPPSEAAKAYQARFEAAAARAAARDFGGAVAEREGVAASIKDAELKAELEDDVALLKRAGVVVKESLDWLRQRPRGSGMSVAYRDGAGGVQQAGGVVLNVDADRVEIRGGKTTVFVEWADVTAATMAEIAQKGKFDPRTLAALCLLEGEAEAAKAFQAELTPRWWTWAEGARAKIPKPEPVEKSARELYASAERGWRSMETRVAAIEQYRALRTDFTSTALVKAYSDRIFRRSEAGKEYYFAPADFKLDGSIKPAKSGKLESVKDSDGAETLSNFAEVEIAVLPGQTYRFWLQVGGCCEETFAFYYQGTELTDLDAKKKKVACDPGSNFAVLVKHGIRNLKKTHEDHKVKGAKVHPKTAARWEWVEIVLPKYAGPGAKKLRFMTDQAGFSIGGAVASVSRKAAPVEAELKELEKLRGLEDPPFAMDPDLVAWWTFDESSGDAIDLTGRGHAAKRIGGVTSVEGKIGGALQAPGGTAGAQTVDAEDLRITGDLTMSIWVKKTGEVGDWVCIFGKGTIQERNYGIWLEANSKKWMYQQYGGSDLNLYGTKLVEVGQWTHLAVTIEQDLVKVFTNGTLDAQVRRPGKPPVNNGPLGLGYALYHTGLIGAVDDTRLYRRALSEAEVRALYESGK